MHLNNSNSTQLGISEIVDKKKWKNEMSEIFYRNHHVYLLSSTKASCYSEKIRFNQ